MRYKRLLEASFEGIAIHIDSIIIEANEAFAQMTAYTREELIGLNAWTLFPEESHPVLIEKLKQRSEAPYEVIAQDKHLKPFPIEIRGKNFEIDGKIARVVAVRDISHQKVVEQELRQAKAALESRIEELHESEQQYRILVETSPHGIQEIDATGKIVFSNQAFCTMVGYRADELEQMNVSELIPEESRKKVMYDITKLVEEQPEPFPYFNQNITKDGRIIDVEVNWNYKRNDKGEIVGFISVVTDITARKQMEMELARSHDELERRVEQRTLELQRAKEDAEIASIAKTKFLAAASHDLRQPVQAISLFAYALKSAEQNPGRLNVLDQLEESADSLGALLNSLLDVSRLDAGVVKVEKKPFNISQALSLLLEEYEDIAQSSDIRFTCVPCSLKIISDQTLIITILRNLISNALTHSGTQRVLMGCRRKPGGYAQLQIWDTGKGIAEDHIDEIFNEFYQIDNTARDRSKGLGLGLAIVKRLSDLLGHEITVRSEPGRGSVFCLKVPVSEGQTSAPENTKDHPGAKHANKLSIIVVEDEVLVRNALEKTLENAGHSVLGISDTSGAKDVSRIKALPTPPDIIIADYRLANHLTGVDAILNVREIFNAKIPAFLLTGDTAPERIQDAMRSGFPLTHKPAHPDEIFNKIDEVLADQDED
ncbi:PAS domain S-box protein [Pseudomonadota bacterium]